MQHSLFVHVAKHSLIYLLNDKVYLTQTLTDPLRAYLGEHIDFEQTAKCNL